MKYIIKQAKCLKLDLERIGKNEAIRIDKDLTVKLDIEAMYLSITYKLVAEFRGEKNESRSWVGNANV